MRHDIQSKSSVDVETIEQAILSLNYRLTARALNLWQGNESGFTHRSLYEDVSHVLNPTSVSRVQQAAIPPRKRQRVFHALLEHYLQYRLLPYENELFTWMKGATAHVDGEKISFKDILWWCQKRSDLEKRRHIEKETTSLCKFLKPFALSFWEYLLELLHEEFGYDNYVAYCRDKKHIDYDAYVSRLRELLAKTSPLYFEAMESWAQRSLGTPLSTLNRFDGIYLLGLAEWDHLLPQEISLSECVDFFNQWAIRVQDIPGLHLHLEHSPNKGSQAMSFALKIPDEIHLLMNPQGGWIDLETLFHEMGHALSYVFTSPELPPAEKDFFTSNSLTETYAFLLQNMCLAPPFLERLLGLSAKAIEEITYYKALKDLSVFRRYASKFLAEYDMFGANDIGDGDGYSRLLKQYTGFFYQPESHLFDLVPEFYALDYVISWIAEATMEKHLVHRFGDDWMFNAEAGDTLKDWWQCGNRYEIDEFFAVKGIGPVDPEDIMARWQKKIAGETVKHR